MTKKDQIEYIWEYYKGWILGGLLIGVLLFVFIDGVLTKNDDQLSLTIFSDATAAEIDEIKEALAQFDDNAYLNHIYYAGGQWQEQEVKLLERLSTSLAVGQIDIFVTDQSFAGDMIEKGMFQPLTNVISVPESISNDEIVSDNGKEFGIKASLLSLFDALPNSSELYLFIPETTRHPEAVNQFFAAY